MILKLCLLAFLIYALYISFVGVSDKNVAEAPSKLKTISAKTWMIFRRIISFTAAIPFFMFSLTSLFSDNPPPDKVLTSLISLVLAIFLVYFGMMGAGRNKRNQLKNSAEFHTKYTALAAEQEIPDWITDYSEGREEDAFKVLGSNKLDRGEREVLSMLSTAKALNQDEIDTLEVFYQTNT